MDEWKPELVEEFLNQLRPENAVIVLEHKSNESLEGLKTEPYYGTQFRCDKMTSAQMDLWTNAG